jgi:hypothetical protein
MQTKLRLQFSIATLLAIVTICALVAHWFGTRRRQALAMDAWSTMRADFESGNTSDEDLYQASVGWLHAELAVAFADRRAAYSAHLRRMAEMEQNVRRRPLTTLSGDGYLDYKRQCDERADKILVWVAEAERWLQEGS